MLFSRTQTVLKKVLPEKWFAFIYKIASRGYSIWTKIFDRLYYLYFYYYYSLKRDKNNARKMKRILSILQYTLGGRIGLITTYDLDNTAKESNF